MSLFWEQTQSLCDDILVKESLFDGIYLFLQTVGLASLSAS